MSLKDQKAYPFDWIIPFLVAQLLNKNDKLEGTIEKKQAFIHLFDAKTAFSVIGIPMILTRTPS